MNKNRNVRLTIGSRYYVDVTVNQGEGGVDHSALLIHPPYARR